MKNDQEFEDYCRNLIDECAALGDTKALELQADRRPGSHISLFSGVGMTDLAVERLGYKTVATAEIDPFCRSVLKARFPDASHFDSVQSLSRPFLRMERGGEPRRPLLVSGGFPCQDVSPAGTGDGLNGERSGLWSEFARVIGEFRPDTVLIENNQLLRKRGLDVILGDLWRMGYQARWDCIPAAAVGAPHLRDRMFIVARPEPTPDYQGGSIHFLGVNRDELPRAGAMKFGEVREVEPKWPTKPYRTLTKWPTPTRADGSGGPGTTPKRTGGKNLRTAVAQVHGNGRLNPEWVEWLMGLPCGWTDPSVPNSDLTPHDWEHPGVWPTAPHRQPNRAKRIRALGNGLVPYAATLALKELSHG